MAVHRIGFETLTNSRCLDVDREDLKHAGKYSAICRKISRILAWTIYIMAIITVVLAFVLVLSILSQKFSSTESSKLRIAKYYINSGFAMCIVAIIASLYFWISVKGALSKVNERI